MSNFSPACQQKGDPDEGSLRCQLFMIFELVLSTRLHSFLKSNFISCLSGLSQTAPDLHILDVSQNKLSSLTSIGRCSSLSTLIASDNNLHNSNGEIIIHGPDLIELHTLDIRNNVLTDLDQILSQLTQLKSLRCLYMSGNPMVNLTSGYRSKVIAALTELTYLDDRPVKENDRL